MDFVSQKSIHLTLPLLTSHLPYNRMAIVCLVAYNTYPILTSINITVVLPLEAPLSLSMKLVAVCIVSTMSCLRVPSEIRVSAMPTLPRICVSGASWALLLFLYMVADLSQPCKLGVCFRKARSFALLPTCS